MGIEELSELITRASIVLYDTIKNDGMTLTAELNDGRTIGKRYLEEVECEVVSKEE